MTKTIDTTKAIEHLRRVVESGEKIKRRFLDQGGDSEFYTDAHEAVTEAREALVALGSDPFWSEA